MYSGSTVTMLEADILLLEFKSRNALSDKGFNDLLTHLEKILPRPNELPENTYQAKQNDLSNRAGIKYKKFMHASNDCIFYHDK